MQRIRLAFLATILLGSTPALGGPGNVGLGVNASLMYGSLPSVGLEFDYNFNPMLSVGFHLSNGGIDISDAIEDVIEEKDSNLDVDVEDAMVARSLGLLTAKFYPFLGSFNIGVAAGPGVTVAKLAMTSPDISEEIDETITYQQTVAAITIGNSWRWEHFYVGFDWIGFMGIISSNKEVESESTELASVGFSEANKEFADLADVFGEKGGPVALTLKIGTGF